MVNNIQIILLNKAHQSSIDELYDSIQSEYKEVIYGTPRKALSDLAKLPDRRYWVAVDEHNKVIATVGVVLLKDNIAALKSMMLAKQSRGSGLADKLLKLAISYAREQRCDQMYLGTMIQFVAARKFYLKNGFVEMNADELPADFNPNPVDKLFYKRTFK